jgi:hypothetical protein
MVINPSCTQIITSYMACKPRILTLGQPHLLCQKKFEMRTCVFKILKQIYRSLARVLRKLGSMALTLELQILRLAITSRSIIYLTRLSLALTSPYNIYYTVVAAYNFLKLDILCCVFSLCFAASFGHPVH